MGMSIDFYVITPAQKEEYDRLINSRIDDTELSEWLEINTKVKDVCLCCSYGSSLSDDLMDWLFKNAKTRYSPDEDMFFEINKTDTAKATFFNLQWMKDHTIKQQDIWQENTVLIVRRQY